MVVKRRWWCCQIVGSCDIVDKQPGRFSVPVLIIELFSVHVVPVPKRRTLLCVGIRPSLVDRSVEIA